MNTMVLTDALVVDGAGAAPARVDVGVRDGVITEVGTCTSTAARRVGLPGLVLAPGFVDIHAHSDLTRLIYPLGETRILQGITTEAIGNCGLSPAPTGRDPLGLRSVIGPLDVVAAAPMTVETTPQFLDRLEGHPASWNVAPLVGHGAIRHAVMGDSTEPATQAQLASMGALVDEAMKAGCWGLSLGLMYAPGESADALELADLAAAVARHGGLLSAHMRAYDAAGLPAAVDEVLQVARRARVPLQISHLRSVADPDGVALRDALAAIEAADVDVEADAYPYLAGHTTAMQLLPPRLRAEGTEAVLGAARNDPGSVARGLRESVLFPPEAITIVKTSDVGSSYIGRTLAQCSALTDATGDWADLLVHLIDRFDANVDVIVVGTRPQDAAEVLRKPYVSVASDGVALSMSHTENRPHPRSIGTFPRALRELQDAGVPLEEIVWKMTGKPAERLGLRDRGRIAPGMAADLVAFDPVTVRDNADYAHPLVPPSGIEHVWVAGEAVVISGAVTGATPGRVLRRGR